MSNNLKTILIADDNTDLVNALSIRCREMGLNVLSAYDGRGAIEQVLNQSVDLICLDVDMPNINGLSVCEALSKDEEFSKTPVIILTGRKDDETIRRCGEMCAYYLNKSGDVWTRMKPVIYELVDVEGSRSRVEEEVDRR